MAVPKRKTSPSRRNKRRSHHALKEVNILLHPTTGEYTRPHHISPDGYYGSERVLKKKDKKAQAA